MNIRCRAYVMNMPLESNSCASSCYGYPLLHDRLTSHSFSKLKIDEKSKKPSKSSLESKKRWWQRVYNFSCIYEPWKIFKWTFRVKHFALIVIARKIPGTLRHVDVIYSHTRTSVQLIKSCSAYASRGEFDGCQVTKPVSTPRPKKTFLTQIYNKLT